jgi:hypothetical protein
MLAAENVIDLTAEVGVFLVNEAVFTEMVWRELPPGAAARLRLECWTQVYAPEDRYFLARALASRMMCSSWR